MSVVLVIPCYNEEARLPARELLSLLQRNSLKLLLVDDGSTDRTAERLASLSRESFRIQTLRLPRNLGKGEAVRRGLSHALEGGPCLVGYADADMATPPAEIFRLVDILETLNARAVLASRVAVLGSAVERSLLRHLLGRVFASLASLTLGVAVYDTQCGAKIFRANDELHRALSVPFASRWAFDVELLGRLMKENRLHSRSPEDGLLEVPVAAWHDQPGSKLGPVSMLFSALDLIRIRRRLAKYGVER